MNVNEGRGQLTTQSGLGPAGRYSAEAAVNLMPRYRQLRITYRSFSHAINERQLSDGSREFNARMRSYANLLVSGDYQDGTSFRYHLIANPSGTGLKGSSSSGHRLLRL